MLSTGRGFSKPIIQDEFVVSQLQKPAAHSKQLKTTGGRGLGTRLRDALFVINIACKFYFKISKFMYSEI